MTTLLLNPSCKKTTGVLFEKYYVRGGSRWPHSGVKIKGTLPHYLPFPFSLAYAAALLKQKGFDVRIIDAVALDIGEEEILKKVARLKPGLVFFECTTPTFDSDILLASRIKNICPAVVAIAGLHAEEFRFDILRGNQTVDFILRGEYEWTLLGLAEHLRTGAGLPDGVTYRSGTDAVDSAYPAGVRPLDELPLPLREAFPSDVKPQPYVYWDGFCQYRPALQMQTSRGCRWQCSFCLPAHITRSSGGYRFFSAQRVVSEMEILLRHYGAREIYFDDDNFTAEAGHVRAVCNEIIRRGLCVRWSCTGDIIGLDEDTLRLMAQSGCIGIKFGLESASPRVLRTIGKPVNPEGARLTIRQCRRLKIKTQAAFTIGLLEETASDFEETLGFACSLDLDSLQVSIATPFPGTEFYRRAKEKGVLLEAAWERYDGKISTAIQRHKGYDPLRLKRRFLLRWMAAKIISPGWIARHVRVIARTVWGAGAIFFLKQVFAVAIDEWKNS